MLHYTHSCVRAHSLHALLLMPQKFCGWHTTHGMRAAQGTYAKVKYGQNVQTGEVVAIKVTHATCCSPFLALK